MSGPTFRHTPEKRVIMTVITISVMTVIITTIMAVIKTAAKLAMAVITVMFNLMIAITNARKKIMTISPGLYSQPEP